MNRKLSTILVTAAAAAGALLLPVATAATAHADEISFVSDMTQHGITPSDGDYRTLLHWGYAVCVDGNRGLYTETSTSNIYHNSQNTISWDQAREVVMAAYTYLC
jgi:hypothetical protein